MESPTPPDPPGPPDPPARVTLADRTRRFVRIVAGIMLVILGLLAIPTPLPIGFVLTIAGLAVLAAEAEWIATATLWLRRRVPALSVFLDGIAPRLPALVRDFIDETRPPD